MFSAPAPRNESLRLAALNAYRILDTEPEAGFDDLTEIASAICDTPIALISLVDSERQWFKSHHGLEATQTPRELAFCAHAILQDDVFIVPDAAMDDRFHDNPLTTNAPFVRFYAGATLVDPDGFGLGTLCVVDHVPRQLGERQLDALRRLRHQVLCQLELRRSRDDARRHARSKSAFLANMSHEIRTPMNGVIGCAELLAARVTSSEDLELARTILSSGNHLLGIVDDILDASKLEAGAVKLTTAPFDVRGLVRDVISMMSTTANKKGIGLTESWKVTEASCRQGDEHRLRQILINLVGNAIKFTSQGTVTLSVEDGPDVGAIRFVVTDTGIGIPPEAIPGLFQRFTQADNSVTRRYGGTGLGLSICHELVSMMGGRISVASKPDEGSIFTVDVPLQLLIATREEAAAQITQEPPTAAMELRGLRTLVVDDDAINRKVLSQMLLTFGCRVTLATDGREALELCRTRAFDVVLMDGMMPIMSGYEATGHIRSLRARRRSAVPIIAITASVMSEDRERCMQASMDDFIGKPITRATLEGALVRVMTRGQQAGSRTLMPGCPIGIFGEHLGPGNRTFSRKGIQ